MAEEWIRIRNWEKWQSYRKDRGQPPWIKIHLQLSTNIEWVSLTDQQRGQLVAMWLLAGRHNGVIPASACLIQKLCYMSSEPDLQLFIDKGFIDGCHDDANVASSWRQDDAPEAEAEAEADPSIHPSRVREGEKSEGKPSKETIGLFRSLPPEIWSEENDLSVLRKFKSWWNEKKPAGMKNIDMLAAVIAARHGEPKTDPAWYAAKCLDGGIRPNWITHAQALIKKSEPPKVHR